MNRSLVYLIVLFFVSSICWAGTVVNIDFDSSTGGGNYQYMTYSGQGIYQDSGNNFWNSLTLENRPLSNLIASDGVTRTNIGITANVTWCWSNRNNYIANPTLLMGDYFYIRNQSGSVTLSGLQTNYQYALYIYSAGDAANQDSRWTWSSQSMVLSGPEWNVRNLVEDKHYGILFVQADSNGQVVLQFRNKSSIHSAINGLQIVHLPGSRYSGGEGTPEVPYKIKKV